MKTRTFKLVLPVILLFAAFSAYGEIVSAEQESQVDEPVRESVVFINSDETMELTGSNLDDSFSELLPTRLISPSEKSVKLNRQMTFDMQVEEGGDIGAVESDVLDRTRLNPGKAILLSALIPGAGEFYIAQNSYNPTVQYLKSAAFFAIEVGFWYGAISYAMRGEDAEDQFEKFADDYWNEDVYLEYEYHWAQTQIGTDEESIYDDEGGISAWQSEIWDDKIGYLPANFTHELPEDKDQQYYEMIGKYLQQFGIAWDGSYDEYNPDNPGIFFDIYISESRWDNYKNTHANRYADMRYNSNHLLDVSAAYFMLIMVNHVGSALDAGFTVRLRNKKIATAEMGINMKRINGENVALGGVNWTF